MPTRLANLIILSVICCTSIGCATPTLWNWACDDVAHAREVTGILIDPHGGGRSLVIAYGGRGTKESTLLIPLDADGKPVKPFGFELKGHPFNWGYVPSWQTEGAIENSASIRLGTVEPTVRAVASTQPTNALWEGSQTDVTYGEFATGYWIDPGGRVTQVPPITVPPDSEQQHILLIPASQARLIPWRAPIAIVATPFAAAFDVGLTVTVPVAMLMQLSQMR